MTTFIIRRLFTAIPMLFGITLLVFLLMYLAPGDFLDQVRASRDVSEETIAQMERDFGLDEPWYVQYGLWLKNISPIKWGPAEGEPDKWLFLGPPDFGQSFAYKVPVFDLIGQRVGATLLLSITSIAFAWLVAIPLGVLAAIYKDSIFDRTAALLAYFALSIPEFFLAILAVFFAAVTGILPTGGLTSIQHEFMSPGARLVDIAKHLILPTFVLGVGGVAGMMRILRANFIDYMQAEFATTARAKGLSERVVMFKHVLRNAINPLITSFGFAFSTLLSGAVLVENIMNYPGLGSLLFESIMKEDQYVVMAGVVMGSLMLMFGNLLADLLLAWSDPRVKLEEPPAQVAGTGGFNARRIRSRFFMGAGFLFLTLGLIRLFPGTALWIGEALSALFVRIRERVPWSDVTQVGAYVLALLFVAVLLGAGFLFVRHIWPRIKHRPRGLAVLALLGLLYFCALFAPFLAPYETGTANLEKTYHPPTALVWEDGGPAVRQYEGVDKSAGEYEPIEGESVPLEFFAAGEPYELFGLIPMRMRLFQLDTEGMAPEEAEKARVYLLGSDSTGRDVFSRLLYGSRVSLSIGLIGISITMTIGFLVGGLSGYFGGRFDFIAMRLVEFLMAIPALYLLLSLRSTFAPYFDSDQMFFVIVGILAFIGWAGTARVIRGMALSISNKPFVTAAESMGQSTFKILIRHILPNLVSYLLVAATLSIPGYILGEAALSFLGLGIQEPASSWGLMLKQAQGDMKIFMTNAWWMLTPGFAILITVIAFNVLGDVLRDIVDPKMKTR
ncbi:MAG: ABC transporter permease subunit [Opitutales bacterium]